MTVTKTLACDYLTSTKCISAHDIKVSGGLRTEAESLEASLNKKWFDANTSSWEQKMENFPKYVKRQNLTRFLVLY